MKIQEIFHILFDSKWLSIEECCKRIIAHQRKNKRLYLYVYFLTEFLASNKQKISNVWQICHFVILFLKCATNETEKKNKFELLSPNNNNKLWFTKRNKQKKWLEIVSKKKKQKSEREEKNQKNCLFILRSDLCNVKQKWVPFAY